MFVGFEFSYFLVVHIFSMASATGLKFPVLPGNSRTQDF